MKKEAVRRYNFIVGQSCVYSGLFKKIGFFGGHDLRVKIMEKRKEISNLYGIPLKFITVSNTIKN